MRFFRLALGDYEWSLGGGRTLIGAGPHTWSLAVFQGLMMLGFPVLVWVWGHWMWWGAAALVAAGTVLALGMGLHRVLWVTPRTLWVLDTWYVVPLWARRLPRDCAVAHEIDFDGWDWVELDGGAVHLHPLSNERAPLLVHSIHAAQERAADEARTSIR
ncbi:MAG: hypothetical protein KC912_23505 [Proteobacteria bacterium]|nr:hypothetical protein [Pseudomonadota bacterium]